MADSASVNKRAAAAKAEVEDAVERAAAAGAAARDAAVEGAETAAANIAAKLKAAGIDTNVMAETAKGQASELQRLLAEELRTRPLRSLGIAAAVGLIVGLMTAR